MDREHALALRSQLFVPTLSSKFVAKAHTRGADAVIVDLEDAIAAHAKTAARRALQSVTDEIAAQGMPVFVRINNDPNHLEADLEAAMAARVVGIYLPKAEDPRQACAIAEALKGTPLALVLLIESPMAVLRAAELASCSSRTVALVFGSEDYCAILGIRPGLEAMRIPAHAVALAARAYGLAAWGVTGTIAEFSDLEAFTAMAQASRDVGYTGALAIHPRQVAPLNTVFGVREEEAAEAAAIVEAFDAAMAEGRGAVAHNGRMLDLPIVERARRVLALARRGH
ncbi:MAG: hypothetical protein A3J29_15380 [Acidobacteria bacterium RIFCSPLOWO2_12_FULL_67_14b]|nr:MAG: hypothetical protein A3J29_15380 [Acidobacteria bacterium RIFCSPLOWO2_12_FULL_67_14b]